jgi:hypothetical protein
MTGVTGNNAKRMAARRREMRRAEGAVLRDFMTALTQGDLTLLSAATRQIDDHYLWRGAMLAAARLARPSARVQKCFLKGWLAHGDHIRLETGDDGVLVDGLRVLLPAYDGPGLTLYRGDAFRYRCRRTYRLSWSSQRDCGEGFAQDLWQTFEGGSVLLCTDAPAASIFCAPHLLGDDYGEAEYLVDRRRLRTVRVLQRYPQRSLWRSMI